MATDNTIGIIFNADVTDLKAGIKEVKKSMDTAKDEFNYATAGMGRWDKSTEGITAKLKRLGTELDGQKKIVAGYEYEIEQVSKAEGDHSVQLEILKGKLLKAQTEVKKTESSISYYNDALKDVTKAEKEENSTLGKLQKTIATQKSKQSDLTKEYKNAVIQYGKNSKEAKTLGKQLQNLSKEIDKNEDEIKNADKAFENLGRTIEEAAGAGLEKAVKGFAKVGAAVGGLVGSFLATAEGTREFRTNMGKVDTAFQDTGKTAKQAEDTYKKFYGILGDEGQATEATALLGELANSQQDLNKWADISTGIYAKFGDSLPIEGLIEAANETAKTGEITGGLADALNWAGLSEDKFQKSLDGCSNEQERQKLITETLNKTYKDASNTYKETNKDIIASQEAQAELSQAMADIGAKAEPLMTQMKLLGTKILEAFLPVLEKILPVIEEHLPLVIGVVGTLAGATTALATVVGVLKLKTELATAATVAKTAAEKIAAGTTKALTLAQKGLNLAMKANPIGIVITLITALVAAFVVLWKKSDSFRNFWIKLWDGVKNATKKTIDAIGKFFSACWDGIKKVWSFYKSFYSGVFKGIINIFKALPSKLKEFFSKAWDGAKNIWSKVSSFFSDIVSKIGNAFKNLPSKIKEFFSTAWNNVKSAWNNVGQFFHDIVSKLVDAFKSIPDKMKSIGKNLVEGLWNGINNAKDWVIGKIKGFTDGVIGGIKKFFGVHSPSTVTAEIGGYMSEGLAEGIEDKEDEVLSAAKTVGNKVGEGFSSGANSSLQVNDTFDKLTSTIEKQKSKLSDLESQYKSAVLTFGESSTKAFALGNQIVTLTRELDTNELKVKNLNDSYQGLSGTLANQMRVELNNAKNAQEALIKKQNELQKAMSKAGQAGDWEAVRKYGEQMNQFNTELSLTNATVEELTANLDYMAKQQKAAKEITKEIQETEEPVVEVKIDTRKGWQKWIDDLENTLGISDEKLEKWAEGTGKYIAKISNFLDTAISKIGDLFTEIANMFDQKVSARIEEIDNTIEKLTATNEEEISTAQESANAQVAIIDKMYDDEKLSADEYRKRKKKIEDELAKYTEKKNNETQAQEKKLLQEKDKLARKQFESQKATSIAETLVNGAAAIIKGFAELGPFAGAINAGVQAGITAAQIATIASQKYVPMLAKGGVVNGATLAMIGENGKEAVMPLENNTGWINELAEKLNNIMQKDMLGNIQGMTPAYAMAGGPTVINNYYEQTINSPKSLTRREIYRDSKNLLALKG